VSGGTPISFTNETQETGLICLKARAWLRWATRTFTVVADDALYVPKGLPIMVETDEELIWWMLGSVEGEYLCSLSLVRVCAR